MRTLIVGDVHGCADELEALLERARFADGDRLWMVGDLVARGPASARVIGLARRLGAQAVRGNHEDRLLRWRARHPETADFGRELNALVTTTAESLDDDDWRFLDAMPLWCSAPEHDLVVVHAGLIPGVALSEQRDRDLLYLRTIGASGAPSERRDGGVSWAAHYEGPPHVVFGHNAQATPDLHRWASGIDTGCVYGGKLTALCLDEGEPVPAEPSARRLVQEPARRTYVPIR